LRTFFCSWGAFFFFALTNAGGGVFSFASSSMREWRDSQLLGDFLELLQGVLELRFS
jgi:hypothetical protein